MFSGLDIKQRVTTPSSLDIAFCGLWKNIAKQFQFNRIFFDDSNNTNQTHYEPNKIYTDVDEKCKIKIDGPQSLIDLFHIFAVRDDSAPNRFFVAFQFREYVVTYVIVGIVVYFDKENPCIVSEKNVIEHVLCRFDIRDSVIDASACSFYNQSLVFRQNFRDSHHEIMYVSVLDYVNDQLVHSAVYNHDSIERYGKGKSNTQDSLRYPRIMKYEYPDHLVLVDLGSIDVIYEDTSSYPPTIHMKMYKIPIENYECAVNFIYNTDEEPYGDGYPDKCRFCENLTKIATNVNLSRLESAYSFGNAYCPACNVRYSLSDTCWKCTMVTNSGEICGAKLENCPECPNQYEHSKTHRLTDLKEPIRPQKYSCRRPYKEKVALYIAPTETKN